MPELLPVRHRGGERDRPFSPSLSFGAPQHLREGHEGPGRHRGRVPWYEMFSSFFVEGEPRSPSCKILLANLQDSNY